MTNLDIYIHKNNYCSYYNKKKINNIDILFFKCFTQYWYLHVLISKKPIN